MDLVLDCQNLQTTLQSLARAFHCTTRSMAAFLKQSKSLWSSYEKGFLTLPDWPELLLKHVSTKFGDPDLPNVIHWFHLTRTKHGSSFEQGILPLDAALPQIWATLIDLAPDATAKRNLQSLQQNGVPNYQYRHKVSDKLHWGPYAVLVRDVAFNAPALSQHDYLGMPEIIEDICNGYQEKYGESIISIVKRSLVPCIVKFADHSNYYPEGYLRAALCYARNKVLGERIGSGAVICFDSAGRAIPPSAILHVEYIR